MTVQRDPDAILASWLEEGPNRLPDGTKRSIAVTTRTTRQARRPMSVPWRAPTLNGLTRPILAAVAVVAVVVGGLYLLRPGPQPGVGGPGSPVPSVSPTPSASPAPSPSPTPSPRPSPEPSVGALTQAFTSPTLGYSIRYPAGWTHRQGKDRYLALRRPSNPRPAAGVSASSLSPSRMVSSSMTGSSGTSRILTIQRACRVATPRKR